MASVSTSDWRGVMNLPTMSDDDAQHIINQAINELNMEGAGLSNMTSYTVTLTSKQQGAVFAVARVIYYSFYKDVEPKALAGMSIGSADLRSNPTVDQMIRRYGQMLADVPFCVGTDETGF